MLSNPNTINLNLGKVDPKSDLGKQLIWTNAITGIGTQVANGFLSFLNYELADKALDNQANALSQSHTTKRTEINAKKEIALAETGLKEKALSAQSESIRGQQQHEYQLAKLQSSLQKRLAMINQSGKTDRVRALSANNAFRNVYGRGSYSLGRPSILTA